MLPLILFFLFLFLHNNIAKLIYIFYIWNFQLFYLTFEFLNGLSMFAFILSLLNFYIQNILLDLLELLTEILAKIKIVLIYISKILHQTTLVILIFLFDELTELWNTISNTLYNQNLLCWMLLQKLMIKFLQLFCDIVFLLIGQPVLKLILITLFLLIIFTMWFNYNKILQKLLF